ncbi:MAG: hypothetical protein GXP49_10550 [Deltaproteobacteria bacterium]|nr:hypothetical protein [Deltaproteobacteria bacterium]
MTMTPRRGKNTLPPGPDLPEAKTRNGKHGQNVESGFARKGPGRGLFRPRLLNGLFGDPVVYCHLAHQGRAVLFDIGDLGPLWSKALHKLSYVFVSHTHLDHFFDFDRLLRAEMTFLGQRKRPLILAGPPGLARKVASRIDSYSWNLLEDPRPYFLVMEIMSGQNMKAYRVVLENGGRAYAIGKEDLPTEDSFDLKACLLAHGDIESACFALEERQSWSVRPEALAGMGLKPGKWLDKLLELKRNDKKEELLVPSTSGETRFMSSDLEKKLLVKRPGSKIAFLTDAQDTNENRKKALEVVRGADWLFCEARYLNQDKDLAGQTNHMTISAAAWIAREGGVRLVTPMHAAGRYADKGTRKMFIHELESSFDKLALYESPVKFDAFESRIIS